MEDVDVQRVNEALYVLDDRELIESYKRLRSAGDRDEFAILLYIEALRRNIVTHNRAPK